MQKLKSKKSVFKKLIGYSYIAVILNALLLNNAYSYSLANGCRDEGYQFKYYTLQINPQKSHRPAIYLIHNLTYKKVTLYHMKTGDEPYVMHLNNTINPNQWAALSTDEKNGKFICTIPKKNSMYGEVVDCKNVLELCEYTNVEFSANNHGNYWSVRSNTKNGAIREVIRQGIFLRW